MKVPWMHYVVTVQNYQNEISYYFDNNIYFRVTRMMINRYWLASNVQRNAISTDNAMNLYLKHQKNSYQYRTF